MRLRIGEILIAQGKLTVDQVGHAVRRGLERGIRFGEAAVSLGYISDEDVAEALLTRNLTVAYDRPTINVPEIAVMRGGGSPAADGVRRLARTLAAKWFGNADPSRALSIISADRREGRTTLAANLACVFALGGARTLLIDGDTENPRLHALLDTGRDGAESLGRNPADEWPGLDNLAFIPALSLAPSGPDRLLPIPFALLIDTYAAEFDVILVDTPAASISDDYLHAAQATGGAIVASRRDATRTRSTVRMLNACEDLGVKIVGGTMLSL